MGYIQPKKVLTHATTWMNLENMLKERKSDTEITSYTVQFMSHFQNEINRERMD
jgi:hypothetical protein